MKISEAPVGTRLALGESESGSIIWQKANDACDMIAEAHVAWCPFDAEEYRSTSRDRRRWGNNFYPHSNIFQWLNASGEDWYKPAHETDDIGYIHRNLGFLDRFRSDELACMVPREVTVAVPPGSRKQFGRRYTVEALVHLPSSAEFGITFCDEDIASEGEKFEIPITAESSFMIMTRTGVGDAGHICFCTSRSSARFTANRSGSVVPVIRLKPDTEISEEGSEGLYAIAADASFVDRFMKIIKF